jgi:hypothetical protein
MQMRKDAHLAPAHNSLEERIAVGYAGAALIDRGGDSLRQKRGVGMNADFRSAMKKVRVVIDEPREDQTTCGVDNLGGLHPIPCRQSENSITPDRNVGRVCVVSGRIDDKPATNQHVSMNDHPICSLSERNEMLRSFAMTFANSPCDL